MGKSIRMTAMLLAVSLLLNMVVLPVRAEDVSVSAEQMETNSEKTARNSLSAGSNGTDKSQSDTGDTLDSEEETTSTEESETLGDEENETPSDDEEEITDAEETETQSSQDPASGSTQPVAVGRGDKTLLQKRGWSAFRATAGEETQEESDEAAVVLAGETGLTLENSGLEVKDTEIILGNGNELILLSNVPSEQYKDKTISLASGVSGGYDTTTKDYSYNGGTYNFEGLGTPYCPFEGTFLVDAGTSDFSVILGRALFNALSEKATIGSDTVSVMLESKGASPALLAENVTAVTEESAEAQSNDAPVWHVKTVVNASNSVVPPLIQTIAQNASVTLSVNNASSEGSNLSPVSSITGSTDAGYLCATMEEGSSLTLHSLEGSLPAVSATNGNAGALVGTMNSGASLIVDDSNLTTPLTIPNVTASKDAGGIVGSAVDVSISGVNGITGGATITGKNAGGLIGQYSYSGTNGSAINSVSGTISNITVSGNNAGGVFGLLKNTYVSTNPVETAAEGGETTATPGTITIDTTIEDVSLSGSDSDNTGGLIGQYTADDLKATLMLQPVEVKTKISSGTPSTYGGLVGWVNCGTNDSPAYVEVRGNDAGTITVTNNGTANLYGGLVGSLSNHGHMLKVGPVAVNKKGTIKGNTSAGGLVGKLESGVLCLDGTVNAALPEGNNEKCGSILGERGNTLVYATSNAITGWPYYTTNNDWNAIGNWGQVLQDDKLTVGTVESAQKLLNENTTDHTVSICGVPSTITDAGGFGAAALRFQLDPIGSLVILEDYTLDNTFSKTLSLSGTIDLGETGLTGFQRDYSSAVSINDITLNGSDNATILLPDITVHCGTAHNRQGLFSEVKNLTISNLTLGAQANPSDSTITLDAFSNGFFAGAVAAEATGDVELANVKSYVNITATGSLDSERVGGLIGSKSGGSVTYSGCEWDSDISWSREKESKVCYMGGFLGYGENGVTITVGPYNSQNCTIRGSITKLSSGENRSGCLIGELNEGGKNTLTITGLTMDGAEMNANGISGLSGGLFGWNWANTDATISGVTVKNCTLNTNGSQFGGLVYKGSGYWKVQDTGIQFVSGTKNNTFTGNTSEGAPSGLFLAHCDKTDLASALYLEIAAGAYSIAENSVDLTLTGGNYFDEIVGVTESNAGNGIVSIGTGTSTDGEDPKIDVATRNTYTRQLSDNYQNGKTRYYYNLDSFRADGVPSENINSSGKMVLYSAYTHCEDNLRNYFYSNPGVITGTLDLRGYSYYPAEEYVKIEDAAITFDFENIETLEAANSESGTAENKKPSLGDRQHYGMHTGIFTTVENTGTIAATLTVNELTLSGTVGGLGGNYGALIRGNAQGSSSTAKMILDISDVTLQNIRVSPAPGETDVRPLLINSIGNFTKLDLTTVTTEGYTYPTCAASSLIGHVGSNSGAGITLTFSDMALDGVLDTNGKTYNESGSIFSHALFLESFRYSESDCSGVYNFGENAPRYTVGRELSNTDGGVVDGRNNGKQYWFHQSGKLVCGEGEDKDTFYQYYPRYVYEKEGFAGAYSHEIDVNVRTTGLLEGCGTYSDPYVITDGYQLVELAEALGAGGMKSGWKVNLKPTVLDGTDTFATASDSSTASHNTYVCNGASWDPVTDNGDSFAAGDVLDYLRSAYYLIRGDENHEILLSGSWGGLGEGELSGRVPTQAFRGVIVGESGTDTDENGVETPYRAKVRISKKDSPSQFGGLIKYSQGSVVKNLDIVYDSKPAVSASASPNATALSYASFFGGVVGWCIGGDTIIDDVTVTETVRDEEGNATGTRTLNAPISGTMSAVGGYVGLVGGAMIGDHEDFGGGVVFRRTVSNPVGFSGGQYVSPYVGRVLDGYAISETEIDKMNSDQNYLIPYLAPLTTDEGGTVTNPYLSIDAGNKVTVHNADGLWLLSAIVNSGAASSNCYAYAHGTGRKGSYGDVRTGGSPSADDIADEGGNNSDIAKTTSYLTAKYAPSGFDTLCDSPVSIQLAADCNMSDYGNGFRGIGTSYGTNANENNNDRLLQVSAIDGGSHTVTLKQNRREYMNDAWTAIGSGLFPMLYVPSSGSFSASNLNFKGSTGITYYNGSTPAKTGAMEEFISPGKTENKQKLDSGNRLSVASIGMLIGGFAKQAITGVSLTKVCLTDAYVNPDTDVGSTFAGGLIGAVWSNSTSIATIKLEDCTASNVYVNGRLDTGGMLGYIQAGSNVTISYSPSKTLKNINVVSKADIAKKYGNDNETDSPYAMFGVGGLVGYCEQSEMSIFAPDNEKLTIDGLSVKCSTTNADKNNSNAQDDRTFCGGLVGIWKVTSSKTATLKNIKITGTVNVEGGVLCSTGGVIGGLGNNFTGWDSGGSVNATISNIEIGGMTVNRGRQIGSLIGVLKADGAVTISDIQIGTAAGSVTIANNCNNDNQSLGGLVGAAIKPSNMKISNVTLTGADILVRNKSLRGAGGIAGFVQKSSNIDIRNMTMNSCRIVVDGTDNAKAGLLYGYIDASGSKFTGANILVKDCTLGLALDANGTKQADLKADGVPKVSKIGLKKSNSYKSYDALQTDNDYLSYGGFDNMGIWLGVGGVYLRLVGVSLQQSSNTLPRKDFGGNIKSNIADNNGVSYVIRADYTGAADGNPEYITTLPVSTALGQNGITGITGDGAAFVTSSTNTIANKIWTEANKTQTDKQASDKLNLRHYTQIENGSLAYLQNDAANSFSFTDFETAGQNGSGEGKPKNFPVLAICSNDSDTVNKILYACISLLTDWEVDTPDSKSKKPYFTIYMDTYRWNGSTFNVVGNTDSDLCLKMDDNKRFSIVPGKYDNQKLQFNLIDVAFKDPTLDTNKAPVYHLYIPVVVQKLFGYKFWATAIAGTDFQKTDYEAIANSTDPNVGRAVMGSHGDPVTVLLTYEYQWTRDEWQDAMDNGQDLLWNFQHDITLKGKPLPDGTKLTLVDRQKRMQAYYTELKTATDNVKFNEFYKDGENAPSWQPTDLCDKLGLKAQESGSGKYVRLTAPEGGGIPADATIRAEGNYYRLAKGGDGVDMQRYQIEVTATEKLRDEYYLTIETPENTEGMVNFDIECPHPLKYNKGGLPTEVVKANDNRADGYKYAYHNSENKVILGSFFRQNLTATTTRTVSEELIGNGSAEIPITLTTSISFPSDAEERDYTLYSAGRPLYQCFELELYKYQDGKNAAQPCNFAPGTQIKVDIYRVSGEEETLIHSAPLHNVTSPESVHRIPFPGGFDASTLAQGVTLKAVVKLDYSSSEIAIMEQFPSRTSENDTTTGITVAVSSVLAYDEGHLKSSSMRTKPAKEVSNDRDGQIPHFYRELNEVATITYNAYENQDGSWAEGVSDLGINGQESENYIIRTAAMYNVSALSEAGNAKWLKCKITLEKRKDDAVGYELVDISKHLSQLDATVRYYDAQLNPQGKTVSNVHQMQNGEFIVSVDGFDPSLPIQIPITLGVLTGNSFEKETLTYANYRVKVAVKLATISDSGEESHINGSAADDYIIYTNAKINRTLVTPVSET